MMSGKRAISILVALLVIAMYAGACYTDNNTIHNIATFYTWFILIIAIISIFSDDVTITVISPTWLWWFRGVYILSVVFMSLNNDEWVYAIVFTIAMIMIFGQHKQKEDKALDHMKEKMSS